MDAATITNITINTKDRRDVKALGLLRQAHTWSRCHVRLPDGRIVKAYGIPSDSEPDVQRLANRRQCSCQDFLYRQDGHGGFACAHIRAVRWYVEIVLSERRKREREAALSKAREDGQAPAESTPPADPFEAEYQAAQERADARATETERYGLTEVF